MKKQSKPRFKEWDVDQILGWLPSVIYVEHKFYGDTAAEPKLSGHPLSVSYSKLINEKFWSRTTYTSKDKYIPVFQSENLKETVVNMANWIWDNGYKTEE